MRIIIKRTFSCSCITLICTGSTEGNLVPTLRVARDIPSPTQDPRVHRIISSEYSFCFFTHHERTWVGVGTVQCATDSPATAVGPRLGRGPSGRGRDTKLLSTKRPRKCRLYTLKTLFIAVPCGPATTATDAVMDPMRHAACVASSNALSPPSQPLGSTACARALRGACGDTRVCRPETATAVMTHVKPTPACLSVAAPTSISTDDPVNTPSAARSRSSPK